MALVFQSFLRALPSTLEQGFIYASSVVTVGLVLLVCVLAATAILWGSGFGPVFTQ